MRQLYKQLISQEDKIKKECIMNKQEIKEQLKSLAIEIKEQKKIARRHNTAWLKQAIAQHNAHVAKSEVRGLLIAYAYLRGKPFSAPEKNLFNENDSDQQSAMVKAKAALGMTEVRVYPSMTVHKPLPDEQFDKWLMSTKLQ
jgi:hypothetical protein